MGRQCDTIKTENHCKSLEMVKMDSISLAILVAVISSGATAAVVKAIDNWLSWRRERKAKHEDDDLAKKEQTINDRLEKIEQKTEDSRKTLESLTDGMKYIIYDRIRHIGQAHINAGEIDFDDRRILNNMHHCYHYGLGGNGDLDKLVQEVNNLPLKKDNL